MKANDPKYVTVVPHGRLAEDAEPISVWAYDALQAVTALVRNFPKIEPPLRQGKFHLIARHEDEDDAGGPIDHDLCGRALTTPLQASQLDIIPHIAGSGKGRGKAILGLTLIGLSFVPGVNSGIANGLSSLTGGSSSAAAFQSFGSSFLGRAGGLLLVSGLAEMTAPQSASPAGQLPSSSLPVPNVDGQGAAIPLAYGRASVVRPVIISSAFHVDTIR